MAITFSVASKQFYKSAGQDAAIKAWLDGLSVTTVHGIIERDCGNISLITIIYV